MQRGHYHFWRDFSREGETDFFFLLCLCVCVRPCMLKQRLKCNMHIFMCIQCREPSIFDFLGDFFFNFILDDNAKWLQWHRSKINLAGTFPQKRLFPFPTLVRNSPGMYQFFFSCEADFKMIMNNTCWGGGGGGGEGYGEVSVFVAAFRANVQSADFPGGCRQSCIISSEKALEDDCDQTRFAYHARDVVTDNCTSEGYSIASSLTRSCHFFRRKACFIYLFFHL